jgi:DNA-binding transcriptional LysR family regulator
VGCGRRREDGNRALPKTPEENAPPGDVPESRHDERPRARMDWDDIRIFAAIADAGGITKAAQALKVTPGMVSKRLDDLEQRIDTALFNRSSTGLTLTSAGEDIRDMALSMQRYAEAIEFSARARDRRDEGLVTIAAPDGLAGYWIAPRLGDFLAKHPKIRVLLDCGFWAKETPEAMPDIIVTADKTVARAGDAIKPLAVLHYVILTTEAYASIYGWPKSLASAVGDHRTMWHVAQTFQRDSWNRKAIAAEAYATFNFITNSSISLVNALRAGAGVGTTPSYFPHLFPELVMVGEETSVPIQLWSVVRQESANTARVQRVAKWLEEIMDGKTNPWFRDEFVHPKKFASEVEATPSRLAAPPKRK